MYKLFVDVISSYLQVITITLLIISQMFMWLVMTGRQTT